MTGCADAKQPCFIGLNKLNLFFTIELADSGCGVALLPEPVGRQYSNLKPVDNGKLFAKDQLCLVYRVLLGSIVCCPRSQCYAAIPKYEVYMNGDLSDKNFLGMSLFQIK